MVFKRRNPLSWWAFIKEGFWPRAGWRRAIEYVKHRLRRLPDSPEKIGRGMFAGTFVAFLPIPGIQMIVGGLLAWVMRGNILAAVLATFLSNPVTTPFVLVLSTGLGQWMLGIRGSFNAEMIGRDFGLAGQELLQNLIAIFTDERMHWDNLIEFWHKVYWPLLVGSLVPSVLFALVMYGLTVPLVRAHQNRRRKQLQAKLASLHSPTTTTATPPDSKAAE